jgi:hypothetical protein
MRRQAPERRRLRPALVALVVLAVGAACKPPAGSRGAKQAALSHPPVGKVFRPRSPAAIAASEPLEEGDPHVERCWANWPELKPFASDAMKTVLLPTTTDEFTTREGGPEDEVVLIRPAEGGSFPKRLNLLGANRRYCVALPSLVQDETGDLFVSVHCTSQIAFTVGDEAAARGKIHLETVCPDAGQASVTAP